MKYKKNKNDFNVAKKIGSQLYYFDYDDLLFSEKLENDGFKFFGSYMGRISTRKNSNLYKTIKEIKSNGFKYFSIVKGKKTSWDPESFNYMIYVK